jgi:DNA polymerase-3 subunit epsilon
MILFFDTETTGLPKNYKAPVTDLDNWPRLVQLAYILQDYDGNTILKGDYIIKPNGFTIPSDSSEIHGISTDRAMIEGKELENVLEEFNALIESAEYIVAHNISFDEKIIGAELLRIEMQNLIPSKRKICTMDASTNFCAIEGAYGYKWPKLSELYFKLFNSYFEEAHNAAVDIEATEKCFWELIKKGVITLTLNDNPDTVDSVENETIFLESSFCKNVKNQIIEYCQQNDFKEIPLAAVSEALMYFEFKCKQIYDNTEVDDEFAFLSAYWKKNEENLTKQTINDYQQQFILLAKEEIIKDYKYFSFFNNDKSKTFEEKITTFEVLAFVNGNESKEYRDLVIQLYYYYLERYRDFLPDERKPKKKEMDYSNYSDVAVNAQKNIEGLLTDYSSIIENTRNGGIPESIYLLVTKCSEELIILKSEVGVEDALYANEASKLIRLTTDLIDDWTKQNYHLLFIKIQGLRFGETLFDICNSTILEINKIETDENTKEWFNNAADPIIRLKFNHDMDILKKRAAANKGCYIATMAYGDYNHPQVLILRNFRDEHLLNSKIGILFVDFYYWLSPKIVTICKNNIVVKNTSKRLLDFLIKYLIAK